MMKLWNDEVGAVVSAEIVLVITILGIGMITGLTSLRDGVITELADVGAAIGSVNQSYSIGGALAHSGWTSGSAYNDLVDFCDGTANGGSSARCLVISPAPPVTSSTDGRQVD